MTLAYPSFEGCEDGGGGVVTGLSPRTNVIPAGAIDGVNLVFTTPDFFIHDGQTDEAVYLRGKRLREGAGNDYTAIESGGAGTGFDTLVLARAPKAGDNFLVDYYVATP